MPPSKKLALFVGPKAKMTEKPKMWDRTDHKPRWELDDSEAVVVNPRDLASTSEGHALGRVLQHPTLYQKYPDLRNVKVRIVEGKQGETLAAEYDPSTDSMTVIRPVDSTEAKETFRRTLIHEIQHAIQKREGFAAVTPGTMFDYSKRPGEQEAYLAQDRTALTPKERGELKVNQFTELARHPSEAYYQNEESRLGAPETFYPLGSQADVAIQTELDRRTKAKEPIPPEYSPLPLKPRAMQNQNQTSTQMFPPTPQLGVFKNTPDMNPANVLKRAADVLYHLAQQGAETVDDIYSKYRDAAQATGVPQAVGGAVGAGLGLPIGAAVGAVGNPIANTLQGRPAFENWGADVANTAMDTARAGYQMGREGAISAPLTGAGKIVGTAMAVPPAMRAAEDVRTGNVGLETGLNAGAAAAQMYGSMKSPYWTPGGFADDALKEVGQKMATFVRKAGVPMAGSVVDDVMAWESGDMMPEEEVRMFQDLVNNGQVWRLQGAYGRRAMELIEEGKITLGDKAHTDYWGNHVPSKTEVQPGTKGSPEYVQERSGRPLTNPPASGNVSGSMKIDKPTIDAMNNVLGGKPSTLDLVNLDAADPFLEAHGVPLMEDGVPILAEDKARALQSILSKSGPQPGPWTDAYKRQMDEGYYSDLDLQSSSGLRLGENTTKNMMNKGLIGGQSLPRLTPAQHGAATKVIKGAQPLDSVWKLETPDQEMASESLQNEFVQPALSGNRAAQNYLKNLFGGSWSTIKDRLNTEGSTWYVWWMDGVNKHLGNLRKE